TRKVAASIRKAKEKRSSMVSLPPHASRGEVSASYADGGVMGSGTDAHDPSARFAGTSPRKRGEAKSPSSHCSQGRGMFTRAPENRMIRPWITTTVSRVIGG